MIAIAHTALDESDNVIGTKIQNCEFSAVATDVS